MAAQVRLEPSARWVRTYLGGVAVADSKRPLLVWEGRPVPMYYFPRADVRDDALLPQPGGDDGKQRYDVVVGGRRAEAAAWSYLDPDPEHAPLRDHIAFDWKSMDAWYEEDDEVFVHPRDPHKRVDVMHSSRHVRVEVAGLTVADTRRPSLLFETGLPTRYYIPKQDVRQDLLVASARTTACPYKGTASYWSLKLGDTVHDDLVWTYRTPIPECSKIENLLSFFNERVDLYVDGELQERPQTPWSR